MSEHATKVRTIYRAVGGNSNRNELEGYEVIAYLCTRETPRYFFTTRQGKFERHNKRVTSNSAWFYTPEDAANEVIGRIKIEQSQLIDSLAKCRNIWLEAGAFLYVGKFRRGLFSLEKFPLVREDGDSFKVWNYGGKKYFYKMEQQWLHDHKKPFGKFYCTDKDKILAGMEEYGIQRLSYLENCIAKTQDYVRLAKREIVD